ncbi:hypothetical protein KGA66_20395, partial [Actinocrinis puniceicyclus]
LVAPPSRPQTPARPNRAPSELDLPQAAAQPASAAAPTAVERLFAQDPLPPAPATDERLPIFEAMESEWFRRRDEARAQAAMAQSETMLPPLPTMPRPAAAPPVSSPAAGMPAGAANGSGRTPDFGSTGLTGTGGRSPGSGAGASTSSAPSISPSAPIAAQAPAASASAPAAAAQPPAAASAGLPAQPLATAPATADAPAADSRGASPMENSAAAWSSPGDEGWKAAQAAAKPVAAGLTTKGLPKRVPRSNLVPGSAGSAGAAKATPPMIPPRSADAVRGRLSSFHQGLRQGRDAATGDHEPGLGEGSGQDGKKDG